VHRSGDKYSANDLLDVQGLVGLFRGCDVVRIPLLADRTEYYCWLLLAHQLALCKCSYQSSSPHMRLHLPVLGFGLFIYLIAVLVKHSWIKLRKYVLSMYSPNNIIIAMFQS